MFLAALAAAVREPRRPAVGAALLFGALAAVLVQGEVVRALGLTLPSIAADVRVALVVALPYLLLRLVSDLAPVPRGILLAAPVGLVAIVGAVLLVDGPLPVWLTLALVLYFVGLQLYASVLLFLATRRSSGVPRQRSRAAVLGSALLGVAVLVAGAEAVAGPSELLTSATRLLALGSALAYYAGFATPGVLKRAWQEPELRAFLARVAAIPPNAEPAAIVARLEEAIARATGASVARIDVWDEQRRAPLPDGATPTGGALTRAHRDQAAILIAPGDAGLPADPTVRAAVAAPISIRERPLGVLVVGLRHIPLFADDDLAFVEVLAEQAARLLDTARIYADVARANARLQEATQAKTEFLANMSHELRTPMNAILGFSDLLAEQLGGRLTPVQQRYFRNIKDAGDHLLALINEVLDLSKVEAGKVEIQRETVGLASLVEPVASSTQAAAAARQIGFVLELPAGGDVRVDPARVRQILYNLLSNAVKFTAPGGRVTLRAAIAGDELRLEVADTGIGIPADGRARVFGAFERLHEGRSDASGTGLGLALTKRLVELHGGGIDFESEEGRGSTFRVRLPHVSAAPVSGARLLIIEDDARDAELIAAVAAEAGLRSEIVATAFGAREAVRRDPPTAVVLDLRLPDERGERVLEAVKADPATRHIPFIVVTVEDDEGRSRPLGAEDHLTKPIDRERLAAWLRRVAGGGPTGDAGAAGPDGPGGPGGPGGAAVLAANAA